MIRRDATTAQGKPAWWLISQIEHARLSGALADEWAGSLLGMADADAELTDAIYRHDDGWHEWERQPEIDPQTGQPRQFTEMPAEESLGIWTRSIETAESLGVLAPYAVAGHFLHLLHHSDAWQKQGTRASAAARQWSAEYQGRQAEWLAVWRTVDSRRTEEKAAEATAWLRFFDYLSLWFCCQERTTPETFQPLIGPEITITPNAEHYCVSPWPFAKTDQTVEFDAAAHHVEANRYRSTEDLLSAPTGDGQIRWTLLPEKT